MGGMQANTETGRSLVGAWASTTMSIFQFKKQQKYFVNLNVIVIFVIVLSSSDDFSVATPDETNGQESEFSLVVNLRNEIIKTVKFSVLSQFQKSF